MNNDNCAICVAGRGLAVYYLQKHKYCVTKDHYSKKFDIVWIRWKSKLEEWIFGFFYAPGAHHDETVRTAFYNEMRSGLERYPRGMKIVMMGDSNARLGEYAQDKDQWNIYDRCVEMS